MSRIVHLGLGAFQAVYTFDAGGWEICGVARRLRVVVDAMRPSGGRYTVLDRGPEEIDLDGFAAQMLERFDAPAAGLRAAGREPVLIDQVVATARGQTP